MSDVIGEGAFKEKQDKNNRQKTMKQLFFSLIVAIAWVVVLNSVYFVQEGEYAIIKRFNKVVDIRSDAGLGFKIPIIDDKSTLTKKNVMYSLLPSDVLTKDKKSMIVDTYVVWRIVDPLRFLQTVGTINEIERRLDSTVYGSLKTTIGEIDQLDIIEARTGENSINGLILDNAIRSLDRYGISLVDVQVKKFDLPETNKNAVFERMTSERKQIEATYLAEGEEEANKIRNTADKEKSIIISQANALSSQLIGEGEREYMRILSVAYSGEERAEFYQFIRGLDALKVSMQGDKTLVLSDDSELFQILSGVR